jgi:hypothetical protein
MTTWKLKSCPHCKGDLYIEEDLFGFENENCLQCGYYRTIRKVDSSFVTIPQLLDRDSKKK